MDYGPTRFKSDSGMNDIRSTTTPTIVFNELFSSFTSRCVSFQSTRKIQYIDDQKQTKGSGNAAAGSSTPSSCSCCVIGDLSNGFGGQCDSSACTNHAADHAGLVFYGPFECAEAHVYLAPTSRHLEDNVPLERFPRTFMNAGIKEKLGDSTRLSVRQGLGENVTYVEPAELARMHTVRRVPLHRART